MQIQKKIEELDLDTLVTTFANKHPCRILLPCLLSENMHVRIQLQTHTYYQEVLVDGHTAPHMDSWKLMNVVKFLVFNTVARHIDSYS